MRSGSGWRKPYRLSSTTEFMIGIGPEVARDRQHDRRPPLRLALIQVIPGPSQDDDLTRQAARRLVRFHGYTVSKNSCSNRFRRWHIPSTSW